MKIHIFYRHYNISGSDNKDRPLWFDFEKCFRNLLSTIDNSVDLHIVMDGDISNNFITKYKDRYLLHTIDANNDQSSFWQTYRIAKQTEIGHNDLIYFLENDYLHINGWVEKTRNLFLTYSNIHYVSLYDHNDKYTLPMYNSLQSQIIVTKDCHWRTTPSTCGTFIINKKIFDEDFDDHIKIPGDHNKFIYLSKTKNRYVLTPIPGLSTHCMNNLLSPIINWKQINDL